jgi:glycosyltransferase involved in cell wall biosynthesis
MPTISVALATFNEESNIGDCLASVKEFAYEIIIVDGSSSDRTVEIAKSFGAKVLVTQNHPIFHINKQKAIAMAKGDWILQLDADEQVSPSLAKEILHVVSLSEEELTTYEEHLPDRKLFLRHQKLLEARDGRVGKDGPYVAFFIPRLNYFLGKYLRFGGVYPDGVIRLIKRGKAYLPAKDVHEQMVVDGRVGWLQNPLYHRDSPTFSRYLQRNKRYISLLATQLAEEKVGKDPKTMIDYLIVKPAVWFGMTQLRHKGILDGYQGIIFSLFSALRFPRAYLQYVKSAKK